METPQRKPAFKNTAVGRKAMIAVTAPPTQVDAPRFSPKILKALNKVLGPRWRA